VHLEQIWQYPVKSMIGQTVEAALLDATGIVGDRTWATRDHVRGGIRGAKQLGGLMTMAARYEGGPGGPVTITFPDGSTASTADDDVDARLSAALDHEVTLESLRPADDLEHYRRGPATHDDPMEELRAIFGRTEDEPLPDFSIFPEEIFLYESPPGTYVDAFPLLLMSTSALRALAEALPDSTIDVRRFRPSLLVDTGDEAGHPEIGWIGRQVQVGGATLDVVAACPRCVMVTREITDDVGPDRAILRHIVKELGQDVGVYATVAQPGGVAVGDEVRLLG